MATDYKSRLQIPIDGNMTTKFTTKSGLIVAQGYTRIVIGGRGPYVEFTDKMMCPNSLHIPTDQEYRLTDKRIYYYELRTIDDNNVKVYCQVKTVAYADYIVGMWYISPFDLLADGKVIIEPLTKDMKGKKCKKCKKGYYEETSIHDDWDGTLHCDKCGDETKRHIEQSVG